MTKREFSFEKQVPYEVDFDYLNEKIDFALILPEQQPQKKVFWEIINFFEDKEIIEPIYSSFGGLRVKCVNEEYSIECRPLIVREVLSTLLNLQNERQSLWCNWYFYDNDCCTEMPQEINSFFLADKLTIIKDNVTISSSFMDEIDPNVLIKSSVIMSPYGMPLWVNMEADQAAMTKWYYKKFYEETATGQILFIRNNSEENDVEENDEVVDSESKEYLALSSIQTSLKWLLVIGFAILFKLIF